MADSKTAEMPAGLNAWRPVGPEFDPPALQLSIRKRPAMYVGGTDPQGLHHALLGLIDAAAGEFAHGATRLDVTLREGLATVKVDGPGLPGAPIADLDGRSLLEIAVTTFFLNGQLRHDGEEWSRIDIPSAAALAETFRLESCHQGRRFDFAMCRGVPAGPTRDLGPTERQGIRFEWRPDPAIFPQPALEADRIRDRLAFLAAYHPGFVTEFEDPRGARCRYLCPDGMADRVRALAGDRPAYPQVFAVQARIPGLTLDVAFQHVRGDETTLETYANGERTSGHGAHLYGFLKGVVSLLRAKAREQADPEPIAIDGRAFERGLVAVLSIDAPNLQFESPTRYRISNHEIGEQVASAIRMQLGVWLNEHPALLSTLLARAVRTA